jgi:competence protein ComEC
LWTTGDDGHNPAYAKLMALARARGVSLAPPAELIRERLRIEVWGPWFDGRVGVPPGLGTNDGSLVLRLVAAGRSVLLTGDIGEEGEAELLELRARGWPIRSDVLKAPHHGSRHSSGEAFLDAVSPVMAIVSAGRFNRFGLPSQAALARYRDRGVQVLRTDRDGAVTLTVAEAGTIALACQRGCGQ